MLPRMDKTPHVRGLSCCGCCFLLIGRALRCGCAPCQWNPLLRSKEGINDAFGMLSVKPRSARTFTLWGKNFHLIRAKFHLMVPPTILLLIVARPAQPQVPTAPHAVQKSQPSFLMTL